MIEPKDICDISPYLNEINAIINHEQAIMLSAFNDLNKTAHQKLDTLHVQVDSYINGTILRFNQLLTNHPWLTTVPIQIKSNSPHTKE